VASEIVVASTATTGSTASVSIDVAADGGFDHIGTGTLHVRIELRPSFGIDISNVGCRMVQVSSAWVGSATTRGQSCVRWVFSMEVLTCPHRCGVRRLLLAIQDPDSIERVLWAMGLPFDAPELAVLRGWDRGGVRFGWFEPQFECPVRLMQHVHLENDVLFPRALHS